MFRHLGLIDRHAQLAQSCKLAFKKFKGILAAKARLAALPGYSRAMVGLMGSPAAVVEAGREGQTGNSLNCKNAIKRTKSVQALELALFSVWHCFLTPQNYMCICNDAQTCLEMSLSNNDSPLVSCAIPMCASECACLGSGGGAGEGGD